MKHSFLLIAVMALLMAPLAAQSVKVVSPNGGESWALHSSHAITWTPTNPGNVKVDIVLRNTGGKVGAIKSQVALSLGSWQWQDVGRLEDGTVVPQGSDYIVRIRDAGNALSDDSNGNFTISAGSPAPTLRLLSPNGGENWYRGKLNNITWKAENWTGTVQLSLFRDNVFKGVIVSGQPSSAGAYSWNVGATSHGLADLGGGYRVMVSRTYPGPMLPSAALADKSDGDFSISMQKIAAPMTTQTVKLAKTVSVPPSVSNVWHTDHKWTGFSSSSAPRPDPKPQMRTGYTNYYNRDDAFHWEYWGYIYRGVLKFDLSQIKGKVSEARLSMQCTGTDSTDGTPYCDGSVLVLDGPGNGFNNPYHHYVDLPAQGGNDANNIIKVSGPNIVIVLTDLVKAWIDGSQPNHGLIFLGNKETMDDESNDRCISHFQASLSVTYVPDN
jgi:hypothetical protein